ncbi:transducin family protein / WD-40 repeat family protein [Striga asiatica]|uniref:Transducin family protein / WD-40 repeat family protein n=1 Tax=Striga asiatica TaxID=4170 RepID=A0A5A7Q8C0_STRAF|nr:transducin family protein / WD-40 repeat family protein [Striga asiatica]
MENKGTMVGPKGLVRKHELVRIIVQCLYSLGYSRSASCLETESCITLKSCEFEALESQILNANWDDCIRSLNKMDTLADEMRSSALFIVLEQCLLECLNSGHIPVALDLLRRKFSALKIGKEKLHELSYGLISLKGWGCTDSDGVLELRERLILKLEKILPPPITLPERRLEHLVEMAVCAQIESCMYHSSSDVVSLYRDHHCDRSQFPTETIQILTCHQNEVWFIQFSNNGEYLASSSSDCTAIIWEVQHDNKITLKHTLRSHKKPISFVSWSPDDSMLLTCGNIEVLKLWDVQSGICRHTFGTDEFTVSSCAWFPDSRRLVCGSSVPKKGIRMWDCDGHEIRAWKGARMPKVLDLAITPNGENLVSIFSDKEIRIMNVGTGAERVIPEEHSITSLSVSGDSEFLIVSLNSQEIHLWGVGGGSVGPAMCYKGHRQKKYVIRSCFGGLNSMFIASGSEDSKVYIWNRRCSDPIEILSGHSMTVNCVSWNPKRPQMLASASDDNTIRIWGPTCGR